MAYPSIEAPYGLVPVNITGGSHNSGAMRSIKIASEYAGNIFAGDPVTVHTDGTLIRDPADAAMQPVGVFMGCQYTDADRGLVNSMYWPTGQTATDAVGLVCDDPDMLFKIAIISSAATTTPIVIADFAQADVGGNGTLVENVGSTTTGRSAVAVDDTTADTDTLPVRIIALVEETKNSSGGYTEAIVRFNTHMYTTAAGAI